MAQNYGRTEIRIDQAQILATLAQLVQRLTKEVNASSQPLYVMSRHAMELERLRALNQGMLQRNSMRLYESSAGRRYRSGGLLRALRFGATGNRDADLAASGALEEVQNLLAVMEQTDSRQALAELRARLRLVEAIGVSERSGVALDVLRQSVSPALFQRIVGLADEAGGNGRGEGGS